MNACADTTCDTSCENAGTAAGLSEFNALVSCLFTTACPTSGTGVCNSAATGYNATNCSTCLSTAQASGGTCYNQTVACT